MIRTARLALLATGLAVATAATAGKWQVIEPDSHIGFVATYDDIPFEARFESFDARIEFTPGEAPEGSFDVRIDVSSVDSNSPDRDDGMKGPEWFAAGENDTARFQADRFEKTGDNRYKAIGELALKDVKRAVEVPFTWEPRTSGEVMLDAETVLQRGDFHIGTGEWAEDEIIGFDVVVKAKLLLAPN